MYELFPQILSYFTNSFLVEVIASRHSIIIEKKMLPNISGQDSANIEDYGFDCHCASFLIPTQRRAAVNPVCSS